MTKVRSETYKRYLLAVLTLALACNFADRYALGLALDNIGTDLRLSDVQLGLLSGIAFALFYSLMGVPIARWADRGNRVTIISLTAAAWSVLVAASGLAGNFTQLMLIRTCVGVGEAGCIPPANSLIADYFTRAERPRAQAIYWQGPGISLVLGFLFAGWLNEHYGWRVMFVLISLPGLIVALLARITLEEPRVVLSVGKSSTRPSLDAGTRGPQPTLKDISVVLWSNRSFRYLLISYSVLSFFNNGITNWQPAFLIRSFGFRSSELGAWLALIYGSSTIIGSYLGGAWASRYAPDDETRQLRVMSVCNVLFSGVVWSLIYLTHNVYTAFILMWVANMGGTAIFGPIFASIQTLVPPSMRAMSIAIVCLCGNLVGLGLGPLAVGALSDAFHSFLGDESLRYALLCLCPGYLWGSWFMWCAAKAFAIDLAAAVPLAPAGTGAVTELSSVAGRGPL